MAHRTGKNTVTLERKPVITSSAAAVGQKEAEGPLGEHFDTVFKTALMGEKSYEKAESRLQRTAVEKALSKAGLDTADYICAGDLLNQCVGSSFSIRELGIPFMGLYGACSTMALSLITASLLIESGAANTAVAATSSHYCSAERQYRFPLTYGKQRTPDAQWTVTGAGAAVLSYKGSGPYIDSFSVGKIEDLGIKDQNNMGAAMAPAAFSTICGFLSDTGTSPADYDMIFTGDLGFVGTELLYELCEREGVSLRGRHSDCGKIIYDKKMQDSHSGGSGCGCSASVLCSYIMHKLRKGDFHNILFCATGALLSPTTVAQKESIPGIAHLVNIRTN